VHRTLVSEIDIRSACCEQRRTSVGLRSKGVVDRDPMLLAAMSLRNPNFRAARFCFPLAYRGHLIDWLAGGRSIYA
jgi:hypothetical protein